MPVERTFISMRLLDPVFTWFERFRTPFPEPLPTRPPATLGSFIAHYAKPFWPLLLAGAIFSTFVALIEVYLFAFVGNLVDWLNESERSGFWIQHRFQLIVISIMIVVVLPLFRFFYEIIQHQGILGNFAMRTRWQAHRYLLRQSVEFFQDDFAGRVAAKMMQTSLSVRDSVLKFTDVLLYVVIYFSGAVILFAQSDLRLTLPLIGWLVGYLAVLRYYIPKLRRISMIQAEARSMVTGRVVDSYTNITTIKMFAHTRHEDEYAREGMEEFLVPVYEQMRLSSALSIMLTLLNSLMLFGVGANAIWLWHLELVSPGVIAFAIGLVLRIQGMSQWILWEVWTLFENIGVVEDGMEMLSHDISITDKPGSSRLRVTEGAIRYRNIHFSYGRQDGEKGIIRDLNLDIRGGEKIGVVGRSGAGKSTLVNLLLRFYELGQGTITIDDQNISEVTQHSLRSSIGMVSQDTSLLHRSVMDNIGYGNTEASYWFVEAAAKQAKAHDFILELRDIKGRTGYDAHVGERGVKLSGGQRQRIAIARALLKNAPILILDEATSALDSEIETAIQESLYDLMRDKTVIAIAHRLSTIAQMDRLVVMENGQIVEQGTHQELLDQGGLYADLWTRQSGGFIGVEDAQHKDLVA